MSNPVLLIRLAWNPKGWREAVHHGKKEGGWPAKQQWAGEDWNLATEAANEKLFYGFTQAEPGEDVLKRNPSRVFDLLFFTRTPQEKSAVVGVYRSAYLLELKERKAAWGALTALRNARAAQVRNVFAFDKELSSAKVNEYRESVAISWRVQREHVQAIEGLPEVPATHRDWSKFHRFRSAYGIDQPLDAVLTGIQLPEDAELQAAGFPVGSGAATDITEGRQRERQHLVRERNSAAARKYRAAHHHDGPPPHYVCDACKCTLTAEHGAFAELGFDVHHQVPLKTAGKGELVTDPKTFCLLCVRCHRLAHASGMFKVGELQAFHAKMKANP